MKARKARTLTFGLIVIGGAFLTPGYCQKADSFEKEPAQSMLQQIALDVKKHYYDPKFHGLDWDARVLATKQNIEKADTGGAALSAIAALLDSLNDSGTFLVPPQLTTYHFDYGWRAALIGDACYVTNVRPGSDAEVQGVKPGDQLLAVNGYATTRENFMKVAYFFSALHIRRSLHLVLRDDTGKERAIDVAADAREREDLIRYRVRSLGGRDASDAAREKNKVQQLSHTQIVEMGDELMILKPQLAILSEGEIDSIISKARKHKAFIVDLRENGESSGVVKQLLGRMFANTVKIGERVGRDGRSSIDAKAHGHRYDGKLIVLIDSGSRSWSELFARVIQIEKRGIVLGDVSSGRVMESKFYPYRKRPGTISSYGAFISEADLVMTDGQSLEHRGVTPDELVLPTRADLAQGRDPVLARAAELAGVKLSPEDAGKMFPYEWPIE